MSENGGSSIQSLPEVPSPLSGATPYTLGPEPDLQRDHSLPLPTRLDQVEDDTFVEGDTFFDDRSLEQRIQRTLGRAPRPTHLDAPTFPPATPLGPLSSRNQPWQSIHSSIVDSTSSQQTPTNSSQRDAHYGAVDDKLLLHQAAMVIMKLKQELQNAQGRESVMKQHIEGAHDQLGELQRQFEQDHLKSKGTAETWERERAAAEKEMEEMRDELQARKVEQEKVAAERTAMEAEVNQLKQDVGILKGENQELASRIQSLLVAHRDDIATFNGRSEPSVGRLKQELNSALREIKSLKDSLDEAKNQKAELEKQWEQEKAAQRSEVSEILEKHEIFRREIEKLGKELDAAKKCENQHRHDLETKEYEYNVKHEAQEIEILHLRNKLKAASKNYEDACKSATSDDELGVLQEPNELLLQQIQEFLKLPNLSCDEYLGQMQQETEESKADSQSLPLEISRLGIALGEARKLSDRFSLIVSGVRERNHILVKANVKAGHSSFAPTTVTCGPDDSIADRLSRIRHAAERAALVKDHQREVARLKAVYESKITALITEHELNLEDTLKRTLSELNEKHTKAVDDVKAGFESRMATMEDRHRKETRRLQEEAKESSMIADESLAAALSKVNTLKNRVERENAKREQLQEALNQLERNFATEKQQLVDAHGEVVLSLQRSWTEEKSTLLDVVQRGCNEVIEQKRSSPGLQFSPMLVDFDFPTLEKALIPGVAAAKCSPRGAGSPGKELDPRHKLEPFSHSRIDKELRETEALVHSLLLGSSSAS